MGKLAPMDSEIFPGFCSFFYSISEYIKDAHPLEIPLAVVNNLTLLSIAQSAVHCDRRRQECGSCHTIGILASGRMLTPLSNRRSRHSIPYQ